MDFSEIYQQDGAVPELRGEKKAVYAEFFIRPHVDQEKSEKAGHTVWGEMEWCRMARIGSNGTTTEESVPRLKRNPMLWPVVEPMYKAWKSGRAAAIDGTPLDVAPFMSPDMVKVLHSLNILTVEDLADLPDGMLGNIGMGAVRLKQQAQAFLDASHSTGAVADQVVKVKEENAALREQIEELRAMIAEVKGVSANDTPKRAAKA